MVIDSSNIHRITTHLSSHFSRPKIVGRQAGAEAKEFRQEKLVLKAKGYPIKETKALVKKY